MQLRIARLCLDCEELHVENTCPICASERYAFLSMWLPSEERRRWRRPAKRTEQVNRPVAAVKRLIANWFGAGERETDKPVAGPRTRQSDFVPQFNFEETEPEATRPPAVERQPAKSDVR